LGCSVSQSRSITAQDVQDARLQVGAQVTFAVGNDGKDPHLQGQLVWSQRARLLPRAPDVGKTTTQGLE
jgi:hypothetical protein